MPAHAMEAVAAGDVIAVDPAGLTILLIGHVWAVRREVVQCDVARFVDDLAAGRIACGIEVFGDRGLAVSHHRLARVFFRVDEESRPFLPGDGRSVVGMALAIHAPAEADGAQEVDRARLQNAGANPLQDIRPALPFQHDAVDAVEMENMGQKQPGRAAADDCYLGSRRRYHRRCAAE